MRRIIPALLLLALALPAARASTETGPKRYEIPVAGSPSTGPAGAPLTVVEFVDFQ